MLPYKDWWVFDSGSGRHICHQKDVFWRLKSIKSHQYVTTGAGNCRIEGVGTVKLSVPTPRGPGSIDVEGVLFVPNFMANIISMDRLRDQLLIWDHAENWLTRLDASRTPIIKLWNQYNKNFISKEAILPRETKEICDIPETISIDLVLQDSAFKLKGSFTRKISSADVVTWHRRFGHPAPNTVKKLEDAVTGIKVTGSYEGQCEICIMTKSKRIISRVPADGGNNYWTRMHVDIIVFSKAWNGDRYALHAYDARGRGHLVDTLSTKDQVTLCKSISHMIRKLQLEGREVRFFHSDNEKGFGLQFRQMLKDEGIQFETAVTYTPEQNGFAESSGN